MGISYNFAFKYFSKKSVKNSAYFNMNAFSVVVLSLCSVATAAPGGAWTVWNQHSYKPHHQSSDTRQAPAPAPAPLKSIAGTAAATPALSTLLAAVKAAGLAETLSGKGDFTVFAPTDDAFAKLPAGTVESLVKPENIDTLKAILLRHVLPNRIMAGDIPSGTTSVATVGGENIDVINNGNVVSIKSSAGSANVIATDINTSNGVVHLVDTVF